MHSVSLLLMVSAGAVETEVDGVAQVLSLRLDCRVLLVVHRAVVAIVGIVSFDVLARVLLLHELPLVRIADRVSLRLSLLLRLEHAREVVIVVLLLLLLARRRSLLLRRFRLLGRRWPSSRLLLGLGAILRRGLSAKLAD